jgi:translation initiation factor IF-2
LVRSPFILIVNKSDLTEQWEIDEDSLRPLIADGWEIIKSSAKAGSGVDEAFSRIATLISVK